MGITVFVPTRERPVAAGQTYLSFLNTSLLPDTRIIFGLDWDEPRIEEYTKAVPASLLFQCSPANSGSLSRVLNALSAYWTDDIVGMVNDDHRFRSFGWDEKIAEALDGKVGVAYANDLLMGDALPTSVFMSGEIPQALGYFALPSLAHMYLDNFWKDIGTGLGELRYLPKTTIEHLHYTAGKSRMDESYIRTYKMMEPDRLKYEEWRRFKYRDDIQRIKDYMND
jgi:hypothetical protein